MNSRDVPLLIRPYHLRAIRDLDVLALPQMFPECRLHGPSKEYWLAWLREVETIAWGKNPRLRLVMEMESNRQSIAGFTFERKSDVAAVLHYGFQESSAATQAAGFALARKFAFEELKLISLRTDLISGQNPLATLHDAIGYREAVRLKDWWLDADGEPHDLITYEAVNPAWERGT